MSSTNRITLMQYGVYLNQDGGVEIESSLLAKDDWDQSVKELLPEYENAIMISNFLEYLRTTQENMDKGITTYF